DGGEYAALDLDRRTISATGKVTRLPIVRNSLSLPKLGRQNLVALWNDHGPHFSSNAEDVDARNLMATGKDVSGLSVNLLRCKSVDENGKAQDEYLYVIDDRFARRGKGETLITGTMELSDSMREAMEKNGITYVNRNEADAEEEIGAFVDKRLELRAERLNSEQQMQTQNSELLRSLTAGLSTRFAYIPEEGVVNKANGEASETQKQSFAESLPNPLIAYADYNNSSALGSLPLRDEIEKGRENLLALVSDKSNTLDKFKSKGQVRPYMVTESQDVDALKHTLKHLSRDKSDRSAQVG
ncbi:MAG: hypothetical protein ACPG80_06390, partial [Rickettsiales bacterium]